MQEENRQLKLQITARQLRAFYLIICAGDIGLLAINCLICARPEIVDRNTPLGFVLSQLNLASENVIGVWFSSLVFLLVAFAAMLCFWVDRGAGGAQASFIQKQLHYGWLPVAGICAVLSFDEVGSIHERLGESFDSLNLFKDHLAAWVGLFAPLMALVALYLLIFFFWRVSESRLSQALALAATLLWISAPAQEMIELKFKLSGQARGFEPVTEEGAELIGATLFLISFAEYTIARLKLQRQYLPGIQIASGDRSVVPAMPDLGVSRD